MRNPLFQLVVSGMALGLMCGAVAIHSLHVSGAKQLAESNQWGSGSSSGLEIQGGSAILPASLRAGKPEPGQDLGIRTEDAATVEALQEIVARLREMKDDNQVLHGVIRELQEQGAETNRDLNELQFRVDSHSQSFRPMRFSSDAGSILRNSISPGRSVHPLLPAKE